MIPHKSTVQASQAQPPDELSARLCGLPSESPIITRNVWSEDAGAWRALEGAVRPVESDVVDWSGEVPAGWSVPESALELPTLFEDCGPRPAEADESGCIC
jgi:hypothetical protein